MKPIFTKVYGRTDPAKQAIRERIKPIDFSCVMGVLKTHNLCQSIGPHILMDRETAKKLIAKRPDDYKMWELDASYNDP